ncbi:hypothetical protein [Novosphingobium resinovorum]|uniref:hypothetical protein n=1 Tax=Novosphingobium resinovorum TaxID=158500 RepID=UPI002ED3E5F0|nr:hypothetical protein [Novosphingobium resinovorum]
MTLDFQSPALNDEQIAALVRLLGGPDEVRRMLSGDTGIAQFATIPGSLSFEERVARGSYGWRHPDLTEASFPLAGLDADDDAHDDRREVEQKLFHFNRNVSSEDAAQLIVEAGFEPAAIADILAFGEAAPHVQCRHPVVGLGSVATIEGKASAPTLWFDGTRRTLDVLWLDGDWHRNYRFLGVRRI